jgi:carboxymethylenebutenolidase
MEALVETVTPEVVTVRSGQPDAPAWLYRPAGPGPHPAIVIGHEATGMNRFARREASRLAEDGFVVLVPDYFRGGGPADPDSLDDLDDVMAHMATIDFVDITRVTLAAIDQVQAMPEVDAARVGVWGWCTGATFSLLAACLRPDLAGAVLYFPSQPVFEAHDDAHPMDPIDLLWAIRCPALLIYGDQDPVMGPELLAEVRRRIDAWNIDMEVHVAPGAGHAFCFRAEGWHHPEAEAAAWEAAQAFVRTHVAGVAAAH